MTALFIDDGFQLEDHMPEKPGLHPAVTLVYRPVLQKERNVYATKAAANDPDELDRYENELIARQTVSVNGKSVTAEQARRLHPVVRTRLLDLIMSFTAAKQEKLAGE